MRDQLTEAVIVALRDAPCSLRALAKAADVTPSTLARVWNGERAATPEVAAAVADALTRWGADCTRAAKRLRRIHRRTEMEHQTVLRRPRRFTDADLDKAGVTSVRLGVLQCAQCGQIWSPLLRSGGKMPRGYWRCPNGCNADAQR